MYAAEPTMIRAAMELSGSLLYGVTAAIVLFGFAVVAFSFRASAEKSVMPVRRPR